MYPVHMFLDPVHIRICQVCVEDSGVLCVSETAVCSISQMAYDLIDCGQSQVAVEVCVRARLVAAFSSDKTLRFVRHEALYREGYREEQQPHKHLDSLGFSVQSTQKNMQYE
jgi:hypothetical protein